MKPIAYYSIVIDKYSSTHDILFSLQFHCLNMASAICHPHYSYAIVCINRDEPDYSDIPDKKCSWFYTQYNGARESIPDGLPCPLGKPIDHIWSHCSRSFLVIAKTTCPTVSSTTSTAHSQYSSSIIADQLGNKSQMPLTCNVLP